MAGFDDITVTRSDGRLKVRLHIIRCSPVAPARWVERLMTS